MYACPLVTRIYSSEGHSSGCDESWILIDDAGLRSCFFTVITDVEYVSIEGIQVPLKVLDFVSVYYTYPQYPATMHITRVCNGTTIRDEIVRDLYVFKGGIHDELWPEPGSFPRFEYTPTTGFEPYRFSGTTTQGEGSSLLTIEITVDN